MLTSLRPSFVRLSVIALSLTLGLAVACGDSDGTGPAPPDSDVVVPADTDGPGPNDVSGDPDLAPIPDTEPGDPDVAPDAVDDTTSPEDVDVGDDTGEPGVVDPRNPGPPPEHRRETFEAPHGELLAGVGVRFIDGPVGVSMAGYGGRTGRIASIWNELLKATQGFYGRLPVKAMALEVEGERLVFLKIPIMSSESSFTDGLAAKLRDLFDLDLEGRIITAASHTHHSVARYWRVPTLLGVVGVDASDEEVIDRLNTIFAHAVKDAIDDLAPAEWGYAYQNDWDPEDRVYALRRGEVAHLLTKDPRLTLLAVRRLDGTPMGTLINFGMHGTAFGGDNDLLSDDAPGALEMKFEEHFYSEEGAPIFGLFVQSGGGDATPRGSYLGHPNPQRIEMVGALAAQPILDLYRTIEWQRETSIAVRSRRIDLRYRWMGYDDYPEFVDKDGEPYWWGALGCMAEGVAAGESMEGHPKLCTAIDWIMRITGGSIPHGEMHQMYLTVARVGDLFVVTIPGEPNHSLVDDVRRKVADRSTPERPLDVLVAGYSQDHILYLMTAEDWFLGGYESVGSGWGPLGGEYLMDRQMELVDDMLAGYNRPAFYEESPNLTAGAPYTPRPFERSLDPGDVTIATDAVYERTTALRFGFGGGDPSVGAPHVVLQRDHGEDDFVDVPSPCGREGAAYDNSRYAMITIYAPDPPPSRPAKEERNHRWYVIWEIPPDAPAGRYRLVARGPFFDGVEVDTYEAISTPFEIRQSETATADVTVDDNLLSVKLTLAPTTFAKEEGKNWPLTGWRVFDPTVGPNARITVRSPLALTFVFDAESGLEDETRVAAFDPEAAAHTFDLAEAGFAEAPVTVRVGLEGDLLESTIETPLP